MTFNLLITFLVVFIVFIFILYKYYFCNHDFSFLKEVKCYEYEKQKYPSYSIRVYECTHCKKIKKQRI